MPQSPQDFDAASFWENSDYARKQYVDDPLTPEKVAAGEEALGYRLPTAYIALCRTQNGGLPRRTRHRTSEPTSWAKDHVAVHGIFSIGHTKRYSLCGEFGSRFWIDMWEYPPIGVYFADCPSAGHDMFCFDYRNCGPQGEPAVVHVDQGSDYKVTLVAPNLDAFVRGLEDEEAFTDHPLGVIARARRRSRP